MKKQKIKKEVSEEIKEEIQTFPSNQLKINSRLKIRQKSFKNRVKLLQKLTSEIFYKFSYFQDNKLHGANPQRKIGGQAVESL